MMAIDASLPVHVILGDESLRVKDAERAVLDALTGGRPDPFRVFICSASEGARGASEQLRTPSLLGGRRVVLVRDVHDAAPAVLEELLGWVERPGPGAALMLVGEKWPAPVGGKDFGKRLENAAKKVGAVLRFKAGEVRPEDFAVATATGLGVVLSPGDARLLVELVGPDLGRIKMELEKCALYLNGTGRLDGATLSQLCAPVAEASMWALTDAVVRRDADAALATCHRLLDEGGSGGANVHSLLGLVAWQVRNLVALQGALRANTETPAAWRRMPSDKLRAAERAIRERPLDTPRLFAALVRANRRFHGGGADEVRVFEALVLELVGVG